jgi:F5/8 type C domain-containing protein/cellulose/xylan binding protein with CBM9 domain
MKTNQFYTWKRAKIVVMMIFLMSISFISLAQITAERTTSRPRIDGKLSDNCWKDAAAYKRFYKNGKRGEIAKSKTSVKVLFDDSALYIGIRCEEPKPSKMKKAPRPRDGGIYQLDCLEIMLDPARSNDRYYHFMVSATGAVYDAYCEQGGIIQNSKWNGRWKVKTFTGKDFWSCEIKIPFYNFAEIAKLDGDWGINVCRGRRSGIREDSSIAENGAYHNSGNFLKLTGLKTDFTRFQLALNPPAGIIKVGQKNQLELGVKTLLKNGSSVEKSITADAWAVSPKGDVKTFARVSYKVAPGASVNIVLPPVKVKDQGLYTIFLKILDKNQRSVAFRDALANVRHAPVNIKLITPWYRNCIFESQKIKNIEFNVLIAMDKSSLKDKSMEVFIQNKDKKVWSKKIKNIKKLLNIKVENSKIPYGRYKIKAVLMKNGKAMDFGTAEFPLWKLTHKKSEAWLGRDGNWYVDGKVFFFHTGWPARLKDNSPEINLFMSMSNQGVPAGKKWLSSNLIFRSSRIPGFFKDLQGKYLDEKNRDALRELVRKDRDYKNLFAYFLIDEPSSRSINPDTLRQAYEVIKAEDPWHPVLLSDSLRNDYIFCGDIQGHHPYPNVVSSKKRNDCTTIWKAYDNGMQKLADSSHKTAFVFMHMGFNKRDFGLGPKDSRIASYDEYRSQTIMALACGMKGLIPYNRNVEGYPECIVGFPALTKESAWFGKAVVAADSKVRPSASNKNIHMISKNLDGNLVVFASNVGMKEGKVTFKLPELPATIKSLNVVSEERTVPVVNGKFTDNFEACEGHVYTSGPMPKLQPVREIKAEIEKQWKARQKKGNLLFQRYQGDSVDIAASSAYNIYKQEPESTFWHVCDGMILSESGGAYGFFQWTSKEGDSPAWIELKLKKAAKIGRIEIYALDKSLKKFKVQLFAGDKWNTVYETNDCTSNHITCKFPMQKAEKIRIHITGTRGSQAKISEIEAYKN